jgi:hypothetical protein
MRVIVQNDPAHQDNLGHIVTHLGMNLDQRLNEFKEFEKDDEAFWGKVMGDEEPKAPATVRSGNARLLAAESSIIVNGEIVDSMGEEDFTSIEDKQIADDLRERMKLLGLDPSQAEEIVKKSKSGGIIKRPPADGLPIQPQRELKESKKLVFEQGSRLANILLKNVGLETNGKEIAYKYTSLGMSGRNNLITAIMMVNNEINKRLGKPREECSVEEFKMILDSLDEILQILVRRLKKG